MGEAFDSEEFKRLLRRAIGTRTQAQFARETGIAPSQLNRMLNSPDCARPTALTLRRIAGHADGVSIAELMRACGYSEKAVTDATEGALAERKKMSIQKRAVLLTEDLKAGFSTACGNGSAAVADSPYAFVQETVEKCTPEEPGIEMENDIALDDPRWPAADRCVPVQFTLNEDEDSVCIEFALMYSEGPGGKVFVSGYTGKLGDLIRFEGWTACEEAQMMLRDGKSRKEIDATENTRIMQSKGKRDKRYDKEYWHWNRFADCAEGEADLEGLSIADRLHIAIFGENSGEKHPSTVEGTGFYTDVIPDGFFRKFFRNHKETFCRNASEEKVWKRICEDGADINNPNTFIPICGMSIEGPYGRRSKDDVVALIIRRETGINVTAWGAPDGWLTNGNRPVILLENREPWLYNEVERELSGDTLFQIMDGYAAELRTEADRDCWIMTDLGKDTYPFDLPAREAVTYEGQANA